MTLSQMLRNTAQLLLQSEIEDSLFEARILLGHALNMSPEEILTNPEYIPSHEQATKLHSMVQRRLEREPASYIVEHKEFYGIDFKVDRRVLIPRPETELLVEEAIKHIQSPSCKRQNEIITVADIGTGSGAIAISIALQCPTVKCYAVDISKNALEVARCNANDHNVSDRIVFLHGNLYEPLPEPVDLICANPPYIGSADIGNLSPEINRFEPDIALDGGHDGLLYIGQLIEQSVNYLRPHGCVLIEIGQGQDIRIVNLIRLFHNNADFKFFNDLNHIKRVIKITFLHPLSI
jgi:release factor glutamine methyltransferase